MMSSLLLIEPQRSMIACHTLPTTDPTNDASLDLPTNLRALQPKSVNKVSTAPSLPQQTKHNLSNSTVAILDTFCELEMSRIFQRNECLRSHGGGCSVAAPLHVHAVYDGQGFGRILHHSIDTCIFAAVLERPCMIDLDVRDKYYTWRSFLNVGEYNWDPTHYVLHGTTMEHDLADAYSRLPSQSSSEWTDDDNNKLPDYETVLPMIWHSKWRSNNPAAQHLQYWHGSNNQTRHKMLLSPSFGNAWWQHISSYQKSIVKNGCTVNNLRTRLQNAMFQPTTLAMELFRERRDRFFRQLLKSKQTQTQTQTQTHHFYGAIHLRSTKSDLKKTYYDNEDTVDILRQCLQRIAPDITTWWLVSDNRTAAEYVEQRIDRVHTDYHASQRRFDTNKGNINFHSGYQMKQKFGHENMAPSIEDFMILHESTVAVMTHGAFGDTGARGNGKIRIQGCGGGKGGDVFKVYRKPYPTTEVK
ncbi:expressed unknown protein [Seminavis robusta]|uniref:Uncharacterized protein n=1 Tax=Seminavis robusta TaxID=568900 RepID=A0A9N8DB20_9STRA|nr:expressed unknown protein [Seminavis robusta]|eukprot:Sro40_g024900.1 n/a (471) ;mRNA; f:130448-131860